MTPPTTPTDPENSAAAPAADERRAQALAEIRRLAWLLDAAFRIPVLGTRLGLEALLGLVPVLGDLVGLSLSALVVARAARLGAPPRLLARMVLNIGVDAVAGSVPLLGDLFDIGWKANVRNVELLEHHLAVVAAEGTEV